MPGTIALALGSGRFSGRTTLGGNVVTAEASYHGPKCGLPWTFPVATNVSGTFEVAATG